MNQVTRVQEARDLGGRVVELIHAGQITEASGLLAPVLKERTPFRLLDRIGAAIGVEPLTVVNPFLDRVSAGHTEGGWVVVGSVLGKQVDRDLKGAFSRCRDAVISADVWYATDILGERIPGPALVACFEPALAVLQNWRDDANRWVRRAVGVAVHFWAKRSRGVERLRPQAEALLSLLAPLFEEWEMDAVKGVGWGLKTLGKHYPDLLADWLAEEIVPGQRRHRALMLRKALTYLSEEQRARAVEESRDGNVMRAA